MVIESFRNFDNAERYLKAFNERGEKAIVVHNVERGWYYCYMKKFNDLKNLITSLEADVIKFYEKENAAAGTRVRKGMQDIKKLVQDIRVEVQNKKKAQ